MVVGRGDRPVVDGVSVFSVVHRDPEVIAVGGFAGTVGLAPKTVLLSEEFLNRQEQAFLLCGDVLADWESAHLKRG